MPKCLTGYDLPYSCEQLFELVADIESYPAFVPGYYDASIIRRDPQGMSVNQAVGLGPLTMRFVSVAKLDKPHHIAIKSHAAAGVDLRIDWYFHPDQQGCRLDFCAHCSASNPLVDRLVKRWLDRNSQRIVTAFAREANRRFI